jgi:hypothetical protein
MVTSRVTVSCSSKPESVAVVLNNMVIVVNVMYSRVRMTSQLCRRGVILSRLREAPVAQDLRVAHIVQTLISFLDDFWTALITP